MRRFQANKILKQGRIEYCKSDENLILFSIISTYFFCSNHKYKQTHKQHDQIFILRKKKKFWKSPNLLYYSRHLWWWNQFLVLKYSRPIYLSINTVIITVKSLDLCTTRKCVSRALPDLSVFAVNKISVVVA